MSALRHLALGLLIACGSDGPIPGTDLVTRVTLDTAPTAPDDNDEEEEPGPVVWPLNDGVRFALIGDFGTDDASELEVADLVKGWMPAFIITAGDNNYPSGAESTMDDNVGKYYASFIQPYTGEYGPGADINRFFPSLGNHDWGTGNVNAHYDYFELPGNERYYNFVWGDAEFFAVDSDFHEPDGNTVDSIQAQWLHDALAASKAKYRFVYMHHAPRTSGSHGNSSSMNWPYADWGATAVFAGHDHHYERIIEDGTLFLVQGCGGAGLRTMRDPISGSQVSWVAEHGATLFEMDGDEMHVRTQSADGSIIDQFTLRTDLQPTVDQTLIRPGGAWKYLDNGTAPDAGWTTAAFDDTAWDVGGAQLGYGEGDETTVVEYGPDIEDKHVTTWFRYVFDVDDPGYIDGLTLTAIVDDGAIATLNGVEVLRTNMPAGEVTPETLALVDLDDTDEATLNARALDPDVVVAGTNVLAVEVHQASPSSDDLSFELGLVAHVYDRLVAADETWRYRDDGQAPPGAWTSVGFDDTTWKEGAAPLGYGDGGPQQTTVSYGSDAKIKHVTTWFRQGFWVDDASAVDALLLRLVRDDGAVVYLNGIEVYRVNMPSGYVDAHTLAAADVPDQWEPLFVESFIDEAALLDGHNMVAVEVHQADVGNDALLFNLELVAYP